LSTTFEASSVGFQNGQHPMEHQRLASLEAVRRYLVVGVMKEVHHASMAPVQREKEKEKKKKGGGRRRSNQPYSPNSCNVG